MKTAHAHDVRRAPGSWRRFIGAFVALLFVAIGIPAALTVLSKIALESSNPLPGIGSWSEITDWFTHELSSSQIAVVVLRVLIVVMWLLWFGLLVSVLSSVASSRPSMERFQLPRLTAFDGVGAWIAAGLTALTSLAPNVALAAASRPAAPLIVMHDTPSVAPAPVPAHRAAPPAGWARVQTGESVEMFAARTLGDSGRWEEIWNLNRGRSMDDHGTTWNDAWRLLAGWDLELPAQTDIHRAPAGLHLVTGEVAADDVATVAPEAADPHIYIVQPTDSYWSIADDTLRIDLGTEPTEGQVFTRTQELMADNADRLGVPGVPAMLNPGDAVQLRATTVSAEPVATDVSAWLVKDDDSYWRIAEHVLRDELGREPSGAEVLVRTNELISRNAERLGSPGAPHMLHTNDIVYLADPPPPAPASTTLTEVEPASPAVPVVAVTPPAPPAAVPEAGAQPPEPAPVVIAERPARDAPPVSTVPDLVATGPAPSAARSSSTTVDKEASGSVDVGRLAGMSAVAIAGLAAAWALRRNRAARKARPHERPAVVPTVEGPIIRELATRDVSAVGWMATELRLLVAGLPDAAREALTVQLVQMDLGGELEVAFAEIPLTSPPPGWSMAAERVWRLTERHTPAVLDAVADLPPVLPALVTLGEPAPAHLLLNLESVSGVNVSGDATAVAAWVNSIVWEIAGAALAEHPSVVLVGVAVPGASDLPGVTSMSGEQAATLIDTESPARPREASMLARRSGGGDAWPPTVVVLGDGAIDGQLWATLANRPSVAVVATGPAIPGALDIDLTDGQLNIPAWGLRMPAAGLDSATATAALEVLATADSAPVRDELQIAVPTPDTPLEPLASPDTHESWETPTWPVMVHLLGEPHATRGGERLALTPQQLSALSYLAVMRVASVDDFNEALWGGAEVKSSRRRELLTDLRKLIGGRNVVGHVEDGRIKAGVDLGTDLMVLEALNARAQEAPDELASRLHEIANLVRGQPFSYPSSSSHLWRWVDHPEHLQALWGLRLSTAAWELAGLYLDRDDPGTARDIAERGLVADPMNAALTERLMESYGAMHAVEAVQRVYESHDRALAARGFEGASEETRRVLERLRAAHAAEVDSAVGS